MKNRIGKQSTIMKNLQSFILAIVTVLAISCTKEISDNPVAKEQVQPQAGEIICHHQQLVKTELGTETDAGFPVLWSENDNIKVFSKDGKTSSTYTLSSKDDQGTAVFVSNNPVSGNGRTAVYPADAFLGYAPDGSLRIDMGGLDSQSYSSSLSSLTDVANYPLWSIEDEQESGNFVFNSVCACFVMQLNDYQGLGLKISSVEIKSASKSLSGVFLVNPSTGSITAEDSQTKSGIKLVSDPAIPISDNKASLSNATKCFLIAIPAGTYPAGDLTFVITDDQGRVFSKTVNSEVRLTPGKVKKMKNLQFTIYYGKANSVIVEPGTSATVNAEPYYSFNPAYAYENNRVMTPDGEKYYVENADAAVLWELAEGAGAFSNGSVLSSCEYQDGVISVTAGNKKGNALVALKDEAGTILWSFHIWVTDTPADQEYTNLKGGVFMDRNLGATNLTRCNSDKTSLDVMGLYYQHGRKDPFACSLSKWNAALSSSETVSDSNGYIAYTIRHPQTRLINTAAKYHWNKYGDNLSFWGNTFFQENGDSTPPTNCDAEPDEEKSVYDPCPAGYKVPEAKYLNFNLKTKTLAKISSTGVDMYYDGTHTAYWPDNGYMCHNTDEILSTSGSRRGTVLCNWTCSTNNGYSVRLFANSTTYTLATNTSQGRATAAGVRCRRISEHHSDPSSVQTQLEDPEDETL